ncbi:MAG: hypothetical protein V9G24_01040 [Rhodoblastus sp.]
MKTASLLAATALTIGVSLALTGGAVAGPAGGGGAAAIHKSLAASSGEGAGLIEKTQGRRRAVGGPGVGRRGVVVVPGRRRGISTGAAVGLGVGAAALGILGAAAAANSAPAPVYGGGCYFVRQPMYDDFGNYLGRRRVRVCD